MSQPPRPDEVGPRAWGEGPIASTAWSPDFLAQTLEVLIVARNANGLVSIRPIHAPSVHVGWGPGRSAEAVIGHVLGRYGLTPTVAHSTSWRNDDDHVILTYLAVVAAPAELDPNLLAEPVARVQLARGAATAAPVSIALAQVLEHALRHLAWLVHEDPAIGDALPGWRELLADYVPEPFRPL